MKKIVFILICFTSCIPLIASCQSFDDDVYMGLLKFYELNGDTLEVEDENYRELFRIIELVENTNNDELSIFCFLETNTATHARHILIKENDQFKVIDVFALNHLINEIILMSRKHNTNNDYTLMWIEEILKLNLYATYSGVYRVVARLKINNFVYYYHPYRMDK